MSKLLIAAALCSLAAGLSASAGLLFNGFASHMVIQRDVDVPLWGHASAPGIAVSVSFSGSVYRATADAEARWVVSLPPTSAGGPYVILVNASDGTSAALEDVLVGEVYICSGQSNMDMPVSYAFNATAEELASTAYASLRLFGVAPNYSDAPLDDFISVSPWVSPTALPSGAAAFSAVCWFALRDLHNGLAAAGEGDVPVGLLHTALGGTPIQEWMSPEAAAACPPANTGPVYSYSGLYNAMVAPLTRGPGNASMAVGGIVWYQGEANVLQPRFYECALAAHAVDWAAAKFRLAGNASFLVAQLHAWNASTDPTNVYYYASIAPLRAAQAAAVAATRGLAALASAVDGGDPDAPATSIHPRGKQTPGARLATAALALRFGLVPAARAAYPVYASAVAMTAASAAGGNLSVHVSLATSLPGVAPLPLVWVPPSPASNSSRCPADLGVLPLMCAGFELMADDAPFPNGTWVPAAASLDAAGTGLLLTANAPRPGLSAAGTRNGWDAWPVVNVYAAGNGLPLLPWQAPV